MWPTLAVRHAQCLAQSVRSNSCQSTPHDGPLDVGRLRKLNARGNQVQRCKVLLVALQAIVVCAGCRFEEEGTGPGKRSQVLALRLQEA
ncbi:MAG: hypothetical protein JWP89_6055 [Schlesneria sp.]|nr:hypothetical protein [Schlesneria sp.]